MTEKSRQDAMKNLSPREKKEWEKQYKLVKGRPDEEDLDKAKMFAQSIMEKL